MAKEFKISSELEARYDAARAALSVVENEIIEVKLSQTSREPTCPSCGGGVMRQKCFLELGGDCPRHEIVDELGGTSRFRIHLNLIRAFKQSAADAVSLYKKLPKKNLTQDGRGLIGLSYPEFLAFVAGYLKVRVPKAKRTA